MHFVWFYTGIMYVFQVLGSTRPLSDKTMKNGENLGKYQVLTIMIGVVQSWWASWKLGSKSQQSYEVQVNTPWRTGHQPNRILVWPAMQDSFENHDWKVVSPIDARQEVNVQILRPRSNRWFLTHSILSPLNL